MAYSTNWVLIADIHYLHYLSQHLASGPTEVSLTWPNEYPMSRTLYTPIASWEGIMTDHSELLTGQYDWYHERQQRCMVYMRWIYIHTFLALEAVLSRGTHSKPLGNLTSLEASRDILPFSTTNFNIVSNWSICKGLESTMSAPASTYASTSSLRALAVSPITRKRKPRARSCRTVSIPDCDPRTKK